MRVALVGPYPWPGDQISGGVERVIDTLLQHLTNQVDVTLIVPNAHEDQRAEAHGTPIIYLAREKGPAVLNYWTADASKLASVLKKIDPDIVHYQGVSGISRGIHRPSVVTVHGIAHRDLMIRHAGGSVLNGVLTRSAATLMKWVERRYRKQIGNVVVINPYVLSALPDIVRLRQFSIPNPLDPLFLETATPNASRPRRIISVGRISLLKQTALGVALAARVLADDPHASAAFYGAPNCVEYLETCRKIAREHGVEERLTFPGNVSAKQLRHELDAASVLLMTSKQENAPVAIAEAQARGVAVLAPNSFGISHMIIPSQNGFFLPEAPVEQQAALLQRTLDHSWDRGMIANQARQTYAPDIITKKTLEVYRTILAAAEATSHSIRSYSE